MWNRGALRELREDVAGVIRHAEDVLAKIDEAIAAPDEQAPPAPAAQAAEQVAGAEAAPSAAAPAAELDQPPYEGHTPLTDEQQAAIEAEQVK
jgi:hypothetical protein